MIAPIAELREFVDKNKHEMLPFCWIMPRLWIPLFIIWLACWIFSLPPSLPSVCSLFKTASICWYPPAPVRLLFPCRLWLPWPIWLASLAKLQSLPLPLAMPLPTASLLLAVRPCLTWPWPVCLIKNGLASCCPSLVCGGLWPSAS